MPIEIVLSLLSDLGFSKEMVVVVIAALPIVELRGAIPFALGVIPSAIYPEAIPWQRALPLAIAGNLIPVVPLLLLFGAVSNRFRHVGIYKRWLDRLERHTKKRARLVERYERIGLTLFVGVPLPVTGAWTGSIAASIFRLKRRSAFLAILAGICMAGGIVTAVSLGYINGLRMLGG